MNRRQKLVQEQYLKNEEVILKRLKKVYDQSYSDISAKIKEYQDEINSIDAMLNLTDDDAEKAVLQSMKQSKIYQKQYQEAMQKQIGAILDNMQAEAFKTVAPYLQQCYEDGFIGTMFDLAGQGIPMAFPLDQEAMVRAVQLDSKISQGLYTRLGEDIPTLKKKIIAQVSRGIATGQSYAEVAQGLAAYTNIGFNNAVRIARTEGHRIQVQAGMDACYKAKDAGADIVKQWDSTLDKRTRKSHQQVDGEIRELDEPFSNGLMFPGDPAGGASEVINCRCALLQRAKWALDEDELNTLKERAAYYDIDKAQNFDEFKKNYMKASNVASEATNGVGKDDIILPKNYDTELAQKFGNDYYDKLHDKVVNSPDQNLARVWKQYEDGIKVGDANYRGHEHCMGSRIYVNGARDAKGSSWQSPYQVTFHESGHAIDALAGRHPSVADSKVFSHHYSARYKDGLFPQTIKDEVDEMVKAKDKQLKAQFKAHKDDVDWLHDNNFISDWKYNFYKENGTWIGGEPKYAKSYAYSAVEREVKAYGSGLAIGDLSDMLEGATNGRIQCGFGHGKSYWKDRTRNGVSGGLATEAFAEMIDSVFTNPESLETIKHWLPRSYEVFLEMIAALL